MLSDQNGREREEAGRRENVNTILRFKSMRTNTHTYTLINYGSTRCGGDTIAMKALHSIRFWALRIFRIYIGISTSYRERRMDFNCVRACGCVCVFLFIMYFVLRLIDSNSGNRMNKWNRNDCCNYYYLFMRAPLYIYVHVSRCTR